MENENQVARGGEAEIVRQSKSVFLAEELLPKAQSTTSYDLNYEFAQSTKNKNPLFYISVVGYLAFLVGVTVAVTMYIQYKNRSIDIEISDFETLNLTEMIANARKNIAELDLAKEELSGLKEDLRNDILKSREKASSRKSLLATQDLSVEERKRELERISQMEGQEIFRARTRYSSDIEEKEKEVAELEEVVSKYNKELVETAQKGDAMLAGYQRIHEIKMKKLKERYEERIRVIIRENSRELMETRAYYKNFIDSLILRYNPIYAKGEASNVLEYPLSNAPAVSSLKDFKQRVVLKNAPLSEFEETRLNRSLYGYSVMMENLLRIPYTNSVPMALRLADYFSRRSTGDLLAVLTEKQKIIDGYTYAMNSYSKTLRENGYIIDTRDTNDLTVFVYDIFTVRKGDTALVFRTDSEYLAKIAFIPEAHRIRAKVIEATTNEIRPFDKILISFAAENLATLPDKPSVQKEIDSFSFGDMLVSEDESTMNTNALNESATKETESETKSEDDKDDGSNKKEESSVENRPNGEE